MSIMVNPRDFQSSWRYKYVRYADGDVTFCDAADWQASHKKMVEERQVPFGFHSGSFRSDAPPFSAGVVKVRDGQWAIESGFSETLMLHRKESDEKYIQKAMDRAGAKLTHNVEVLYDFMAKEVDTSWLREVIASGIEIESKP